MLWWCHADFVSLSNSFFHFKQFSIQSQTKGLKVTTDACLLGRMAVHTQARHILDIGTGTGVVALMLAQANPEATITAIEIQNSVYEEAILNVQSSPFAHRIQLIHNDFLKVEPVTYDLIVCNPPYFSEHLSGKNPEKNVAMHNTTLNHEQLFAQVRLCMHEASKFYLILPSEISASRIEMAKGMGMYATSITEIEKKKDIPYRRIICFSLKDEPLSRSKLILQTDEGRQTDKFKELMQDYYLEDSSQYKKVKNTNSK